MNPRSRSRSRRLCALVPAGSSGWCLWARADSSWVVELCWWLLAKRERRDLGEKHRSLCRFHRFVSRRKGSWLSQVDTPWQNGSGQQRWCAIEAEAIKTRLRLSSATVGERQAVGLSVICVRSGLEADGRVLWYRLWRLG